MLFSEHEVSAKFAGEVHSEPVVPIHGDDLGGAHGFRGVHGEESDGAKSVDGHRCSFHRSARQRVNGVSEGVLDGSMFWSQSFGHRSGVDRGDDKVRCEGAVVVHAEDAPLLADVGISFQAAGAGPAGQVAFDGNEVADLPVGHSFSQSRDFAARFVPRHRAKRDVLTAPLVPLPDVQVGATNAGRFGSNEDFAFARRGNGVLDEVKPVGFVADFGPRHHRAAVLHGKGLGPRPLRFDLRGSSRNP